MRSCSVSTVSSSEHRHRLLGEDRAVVDLEPGEVHGAAVTFTPAASASSTACQPLNAGSSAGCVLTMRSGKASWIGFARIVPKPGHRDEVDVVARERVDDLVGVRDAVEVGAEASCARPARPGRRRRRRSSSAPHGRSTSTTDDREVGVEHARAGSCRSPTRAHRSAHAAKRSRAGPGDGSEGPCNRPPSRDGLDRPMLPRRSGSRDVRRETGMDLNKLTPGEKIIAVSGDAAADLLLLPLVRASIGLGDVLPNRLAAPGRSPCAGSPRSCSASSLRRARDRSRGQRASSFPTLGSVGVGRRSSSAWRIVAFVFILIKVIVGPGTGGVDIGAVRRLQGAQDRHLPRADRVGRPRRRRATSTSKEAGELPGALGRRERVDGATAAPTRLIASAHDRRRRSRLDGRSRLGWRAQRRPRPGFRPRVGRGGGRVRGRSASSRSSSRSTTDDPTGPGVAFTAGARDRGAGGGLPRARPAPRRRASPRSCSPSRCSGSSRSSATATAVAATIRGVYLLTLRVLPACSTCWAGRRVARSSSPARCSCFASWVDVRGRGSDSDSRHPVPERDRESAAPARLRRHRRTPLSRRADDTTDATARGRAASSGSCSSASARCSTGASSTARPRPFVAVGAVETIVGAVVLGGNESVLLGGLLAVVAGAVVGIVGGRGDRRRATTWIGVLVVFGGLRRGARRHRARQRGRRRRHRARVRGRARLRSRGGSRRCSASPTTATSVPTHPTPRRPAATSCRCPSEAAA